MNNILKASFAFHNLAHHAEVIPVLPHFDRPVGTFDTQLIPYVIEQGEREAQEQIPYLRRLVEAGKQLYAGRRSGFLLTAPKTKGPCIDEK